MDMNKMNIYNSKFYISSSQSKKRRIQSAFNTLLVSQSSSDIEKVHFRQVQPKDEHFSVSDNNDFKENDSVVKDSSTKDTNTSTSGSSSSLKSVSPAKFTPYNTEDVDTDTTLTEDSQGTDKLNSDNASNTTADDSTSNESTTDSSTNVKGSAVTASYTQDNITRVSIRDKVLGEVKQIEGTLNINSDTKGVRYVSVQGNELWIYYEDSINMNDIMDSVINLINDAHYNYLTFNRLARKYNAIVFDILSLKAE